MRQLSQACRLCFHMTGIRSNCRRQEGFPYSSSRPDRRRHDDERSAEGPLWSFDLSFRSLHSTAAGDLIPDATLDGSPALTGSVCVGMSIGYFHAEPLVIGSADSYLIFPAVRHLIARVTKRHQPRNGINTRPSSRADRPPPIRHRASRRLALPRYRASDALD